MGKNKQQYAKYISFFLLSTILPFTINAMENKETAVFEQRQVNRPSKNVPKTDQDKSDMVKKIVVCKGNKSVGTGFLLKFKKTKIIVTCMHVFMGNKTIKFINYKNEKLKYSSVYIPSDGRDLIFFVLKDQRKKIPLFDIAKNISQNVKVGAKIINLGNNDGEGVITEEKGEILGFGPKKIETNLENVQGSSGSPILYNGKVIAVETYATQKAVNWCNQNTRYCKKRCFGTRIDTVKKISKVNLFHYKRKIERIEKFNKYFKEFSSIDKNLSYNIAHTQNLFSWWDDYRQLDELRKKLNRLVWELKKQCKRSIPPVEDLHKRAAENAQKGERIVGKIKKYLDSVTNARGKINIDGKVYSKRGLGSRTNRLNIPSKQERESDFFDSH